MVTKAPRILIYGTFAPQNFEFCWLEWLKEHHYRTLAVDHSDLLKKYVPYKENGYNNSQYVE